MIVQRRQSQNLYLSCTVFTPHPNLPKNIKNNNTILVHSSNILCIDDGVIQFLKIIPATAYHYYILISFDSCTDFSYFKGAERLRDFKIIFWKYFVPFCLVHSETLPPAVMHGVLY